MRVTAGLFSGLAAMASVSFAAPPSDQSPIYLRGYFKLYDNHAIWQYTDGSPWYVVKSASWADARLLQWGYVPVTHDSQRYYCLIDRLPPTGSHILEWTFTCGDPATVEVLYNTRRNPLGILHGVR